MSKELKKTSDEIADQNLDQVTGGEGGGTGVANNRNILWGDYVYEGETIDDLKSDQDTDSPIRSDR